MLGPFFNNLVFILGLSWDALWHSCCFPFFVFLLKTTGFIMFFAFPRGASWTLSWTLFLGALGCLSAVAGAIEGPRWEDPFF